MKYHQISAVIVFGAGVVAITTALIAQSNDKFALKASNGIAFSDFKGYEEWPLIATSQHDGSDGCGTSKTGCMKAIVGNPLMMQAYRDGMPANGRPVPEGAAMAKIEWSKSTDDAAPYQITVPGTQTEVAFMIKDSKRFNDTDGWGYATLAFDAASNSYTPKASLSDPAFGKTSCHACHTAGARATDFVFTNFARR